LNIRVEVADCDETVNCLGDI